MDVTTDGEESTGCYNCGSPEGTVLTLCTSCSEAGASGRNKLKARLAVDTTGIEDPFIYKVTNIDNANWLVVSALFVTLLLGALFTALVAKMAFSVSFLLVTFVISLGVVVVSIVALVRESFALSLPLGLFMLIGFPLTPFLAFLPKKMFTDPAVLISIKTTVGALVAGFLLLVSTFIAANVLGVNLLKPQTYWRAAANFESTSPRPNTMLSHHFD